MEEKKPIPSWMLHALTILLQERDRLQKLYDEREAAAEEARRVCVPVQQILSKVKDAIHSLNHAAEWATDSAWEVPL